MDREKRYELSGKKIEFVALSMCKLVSIVFKEDRGKAFNKFSFFLFDQASGPV